MITGRRQYVGKTWGSAEILLPKKPEELFDHTGISSLLFMPETLRRTIFLCILNSLSTHKFFLLRTFPNFEATEKLCALMREL
jgi:hypothetical protein